MKTILDAFGLVGSAGQSPAGFPCSFVASTAATASPLQSDGTPVTSAPGTPDLVAASDTGVSAVDNITNDTTPTFRVSLPPEAIAANVVRVYRAGTTEIGNKTLDGTDIANGYADITASILTSGDHTITARVQNDGGLSLPSSGLAITVDAVAPDPPTAIVVTPLDQGDHALQTENTQPTFRITLPANAAAGDVATLEIDTVADATAALSGTDIANGYVDIQSANILADDTLYDISAFLTDLAGNQGVSSSAVEVEVGSAINEVPAVVYVGAGFLVVNAATHGAADGAQVHGAAFLRFRSDGSLMYLRASGGTQAVYVRRNADNTIEFAAPGVFSCVTAAVPASTGWCLVAWSANGTAAQLTVNHAGGVVTGVNTPGSATNLSLAQDWHYGEDAAGGNRLHADVGMWWEKAGQSIDLSDANVRENWYDTTNLILRDPGAGGGNPVDSAYTPDFFVAAWSATHGAGADAAGVFTDGTTPGEYAADYNPVSLEFGVAADPVEQNFNGNPRTFSAISFGAAASGRILHAVFLGCAAATITFSGATLDGDAMTIDAVVTQTNSNQTVFCIVASIAQSAMSNPSATSGDVVFSFNGNLNGCKMTLFRSVGYSATPTDALQVANTTPNSGTIDFPDNGIALGAVMDYGGATGYAWSSPFTEQFDDGMRFAGRGSLAFASGLTAGLGTTVTATVDSGGGAPCGLACATYPVA